MKNCYDISSEVDSPVSKVMFDLAIATLENIIFLCLTFDERCNRQNIISISACWEISALPIIAAKSEVVSYRKIKCLKNHFKN